MTFYTLCCAISQLISMLRMHTYIEFLECSSITLLLELVYCATFRSFWTPQSVCIFCYQYDSMFFTENNCDAQFLKKNWTFDSLVNFQVLYLYQCIFFIGQCFPVITGIYMIHFLILLSSWLQWFHRLVQSSFYFLA